ncbi:MAG: DUF4252 domain-containing protein [Bryobacterales bacterium]
MRYGAWILTLVLVAPVWGLTGAKVDVDQPGLEKKADEVVEVNLEGKSLEQGSRLLAIRQGMSGSVKSLLTGLKGIYRRTYRFATGSDGYEEADISSIHERVMGEGWEQVIGVQDKNKREAVSVYSYTEGENVSGVFVVSSDPSEVTLVNIVGDVDLQTLVEAGESFGVPTMQIGSTELEKLKVKLPTKTPPPATQKSKP